MKNLIFINSHPIQYFAPMYKYMNERGVKTEAWYCSDESIVGGIDRQFGTEVKWDIPLLQGYDSTFFKNYSWKSSHFNGFFGLMNLNMILNIFRIPKSVIVVHGWHYFTHLSILLLGRLKGHTICLRCEMPNNQEVLKKGFKQSFKRFTLKHFLFPRVSYFFNIGTQNKDFYKSYGIEDKRIVFCPYSVDNDRFRKSKDDLNSQIEEIRSSLGIAKSDKVILYSGKYITKKRPMDLLEAYIKLNKENCWLLFVGDGNLRSEIEALIAKHDLKKVILTGFINQSDITKYYAISDVFVMCSSIGETWGLSVNEAMNFNMPIIVSDVTGCSVDLVKQGVNGYVFETGNVDDLAAKLNEVLENKLTWDITSIEVVDKYSYQTVSENLKMLV